MTTYRLLNERGSPVGRMILDDCGNRYAVLDCLPKPLTVVELAPGEPWRFEKMSGCPPGGRGPTPPGISTPRGFAQTQNFEIPKFTNRNGKEVVR